MEYLLPDLPVEDERGPLPNYSPEIAKEIEAEVVNKRVSLHLHFNLGAHALLPTLADNSIQENIAKLPLRMGVQLEERPALYSMKRTQGLLTALKHKTVTSFLDL